MTEIKFKNKLSRRIRSITLEVPKVFEGINATVVAEREKLVPNRKQRIDVIKLAKERSIGFEEALRIFNNPKAAPAAQEVQAKPKIFLIGQPIQTTNQPRKKAKKKKPYNKPQAVIVSGGGGPGTGKRR